MARIIVDGSQSEYDAARARVSQEWGLYWKKQQDEHNESGIDSRDKTKDLYKRLNELVKFFSEKYGVFKTAKMVESWNKRHPEMASTTLRTDWQAYHLSYDQGSLSQQTSQHSNERAALSRLRARRAGISFLSPKKLSQQKSSR